MAGMLPGVEHARRRRCRLGSSSDSTSISRSLHPIGHEAHLTAYSSRRGTLDEGLHGGSLGDIAREAKERLDGRLRASEFKRYITHRRAPSNNGGTERELGGTSVLGRVQREVFCSKKCLRKFSWIKMGWKAMEQHDCAVCLEEFQSGDILVHLPCAHRFHQSCAMPWLETNSHCPCCRTSILS